MTPTHDDDRPDASEAHADPPHGRAPDDSRHGDPTPPDDTPGVSPPASTPATTPDFGTVVTACGDASAVPGDAGDATASSAPPMPAPAPLPPGTLDDDGTLAVERPCRQCGFLLKGLRPDGACPECGFSVARSLEENVLDHADPRWLRSVRRGIHTVLWTLLLGWLLVFAASFAMMFAFGAFAGAGGPGTGGGTGGGAGAAGGPNFAAVFATAGAVQLVTGLVIAIVKVTGIWWYTTPDPGQPPSADRGSGRTLARWCGFAAFPAALVAGWSSMGGGAMAAGAMGGPGALATGAGMPFWAVAVLGSIAQLVACVGWFAAMHYASRLWERAPMPGRARLMRIAAMGFGIAYGLQIVLSLGVVVVMFATPAGAALTGGPGAAGGAAGAGGAAAPPMPPMRLLGLLSLFGCTSVVGSLAAFGFGVIGVVLAFMLASRLTRALRHAEAIGS